MPPYGHNSGEHLIKNQAIILISVDLSSVTSSTINLGAIA